MSALDSTKLADEAAARKKYMSVSPADGAATIAETDLKTGVGDFPKALPFTRIYRSDVGNHRDVRHDDK